MIAKLGLIPLTIGLIFLGLSVWFWYWPDPGRPGDRILAMLGVIAAIRFAGFALVALLAQVFMNIVLTMFKKRDRLSE